MRCPHCLHLFVDNARPSNLEYFDENYLMARTRKCPGCGKVIISLVPRRSIPGGGYEPLEEIIVWPKTSSRSPIPPEVPLELAEDYREACLVLADSPKASAALSRRCLQNLLRGYAGIKQGSLANEIQQVIDSQKLPSHLVENIDYIRNVGNFAAHPLKDTQTGQIVPVEAGEAEWNLDVLEMLFDFYFVQPALAQKKRDALNQKLANSGNNPMK